MFYYRPRIDDEGLWLVEEQYSSNYIHKTASVFSQCNGYLGVRASQDFAGVVNDRGMFVRGLYDKAPSGEMVELVNCPDLVEVCIKVNTHIISLDTSQVDAFQRRLNVRTGELVSEYSLSAHGFRFQICSRRFASAYSKKIFCQKMELSIFSIDSHWQKENNVEISFGINGQMTNSGVSHFLNTECYLSGQNLVYQGSLQKGGLMIVEGYTLKTKNATIIRNDAFIKRRSIFRKVHLRFQEAMSLCLERISVVDADLPERNMLNKKVCVTTAEREISFGYDRLFRNHCDVMREYWKQCELIIDGASDEETAGIAFAQYHLFGMTPIDDGYFSIAAKGLTGEGYYGHIFWDTEIYILPFIIYEFPDVARKILLYRYRCIPGAIEKAKEYGYRGFMFPWESAQDGHEETPHFSQLNIHTGKATEVKSGVQEHHVTADIAYAVWMYYKMTGDFNFIRDYGAEIIFGAADFWVSRASERNGRLEILKVIGPDEYNEDVDNNAYTNYMAWFCVHIALILSKELDKPTLFRIGVDSKSLNSWEYFCKHIYLPKPNAEGIIPQDDTFLKKKCLVNISKYKYAKVQQAILLDYSRDEVINMQVLKQADTAMLFDLLPDLFNHDTCKKNVLFYENRTLHDSSLSYCSYAEACASIGEVDMAWKFFTKALETDLSCNPFYATDGIHAAAMGGIWKAVICGFAGLKVKNGHLISEPHLPAAWKGMHFSIKYHGQNYKIDIADGKTTISKSELPE